MGADFYANFYWLSLYWACPVILVSDKDRWNLIIRRLNIIDASKFRFQKVAQIPVGGVYVERYARILISLSPTLAFEGGKYVREINQAHSGA